MIVCKENRSGRGIKIIMYIRICVEIGPESSKSDWEGNMGIIILVFSYIWFGDLQAQNVLINIS